MGWKLGKSCMKLGTWGKIGYWLGSWAKGGAKSYFAYRINDVFAPQIKDLRTQKRNYKC